MSEGLKTERVFSKLVEVATCHGQCGEAVAMLCDSCVKSQRLTKRDIRHLHMEAPSSSSVSAVVDQPRAPPVRHYSDGDRPRDVIGKPSVSTVSEMSDSGFAGSRACSPSRGLLVRSERMRRQTSDGSEGSVFDSDGPASHNGSPSCKTAPDRLTLSRLNSTSSRDYKSKTPVIDMKPIEFWAANREAVQPRAGRRPRMSSDSEISIESLNVTLYDKVEDKVTDELTDDQLLAKHKLGKVGFKVNYDVEEKRVAVTLTGARELPRPGTKDNSRHDQAHSNPYVKLSLLPDTKNAKHSSVARKTQSPKWEEVFTFPLSLHEAQQRTLELTVKDFDKFSRNYVIGETHLPLCDVNLLTLNNFWKPLVPCNKRPLAPTPLADYARSAARRRRVTRLHDDHAAARSLITTVSPPLLQTRPDLGEILLTLNYLPSAGRLNLDVIKAKQLLRTDVIGEPDSFVKASVCLNEKAVKTKKTSVRKNTMDPVFNENLSFNIHKDDIEHVTLQVSVWDHHAAVRDEQLGAIVLGCHGSGPDEVNHWSRMLQCTRQPVAQWHSLLQHEECVRQAPVTSQTSVSVTS